MVLQPHKWSGNKQHFLTFPKVMASKLFEWDLKLKLKYNLRLKIQIKNIKKPALDDSV